MIRLFIIEDHKELVVTSFKYEFRPKRDNIIVAGAAENMSEAIKKMNSECFDLIILDLYLPNHLPVENIRTLKNLFPDKPVIIYSTETASSWKKKMIQEGAAGYVTKNSMRRELKTTIERAANHEAVFYSDIENDSINNQPDSSQIALIELTPFQQKVIELIKEGLTHKTIADRLGIKRSKIEKTLKSLKRTFKAKNTAELLGLLNKSGLV
jgi:DNA-binding NarL/FixJ family response regulator